jgi:DNA repair protein RadC
MVLSQWPASERPRERFIAEGANKLTDAELIALVLHTGVRGRSTVDLELSHRHLAEPLAGRNVLENSTATRNYFRALPRLLPQGV